MEMFLGFVVMIGCVFLGLWLQKVEAAVTPPEDVEAARDASQYMGHERAQDRHVGPNGGVYRISASGRKVYLKKNGTNYHRKARTNGWGF